MNYYQPSNLAALREIVGAQEGHCRFVAGCTDFLAQRNGRPWTKEALISLSEVGEMRRISAGAAGIFIGAACIHGQIAKDAMVRQHFPALAQACANVGSPQIRNRGTIGGSIANASPGGDIYPVLLLLGARALILDPAGNEKRLQIQDVVLAKGKTALKNKEVIWGFEVPIPCAGQVSAFGKLGERKVVTIAKINLAIATVIKDGIMNDSRVVLGAVSEKAFFVEGGGAILNGKPYGERFSCGLDKLLSDTIHHAIAQRLSMPYKKEAIYGLTLDVLASL